MFDEGKINLDFQVSKRALPCYYKLGWDSDLPGFVFGIRNELIPRMYELLTPNTPIIGILKQDQGLDLAEFVPPTEDEWGFGPSIKRIGQDEDFTNFQAQIPSGLPGISSFRRRSIDLSVSLNLLTSFLNYEQELLPPILAESQLISFTMKTEGVFMHGFALWVHLSKALVDWLRSFEHGCNLTDVEKAMIQVRRVLRPDDTRSDVEIRYNFSAEFTKPCWINLSVPGNACGLDPCEYEDERKGYKLSPHNTDSPVQQLSLLAGVAKLCSMYREANK